MILSCEKNSVIPGDVFVAPDNIRKRQDKLLKGFNENLFCTWNITFQRWEIWERGNKGRNYMVKAVDGREIDYRDIEDLAKRDIRLNSFKGLYIEDLVEGQNLDRELDEEFSLSNSVYDVSVQEFNRIMDNTVIQGYRRKE